MAAIYRITAFKKVKKFADNQAGVTIFIELNIGQFCLLDISVNSSNVEEMVERDRVSMWFYCFLK